MMGMNNSSIQCSNCGCTSFSYVNKDAAHIGLYCDSCGKWLKWAGKKEYANKNIMSYAAFQVKINQNNTLMSQADVQKSAPEYQPNNGYVQGYDMGYKTQEVQSQPVEPVKPVSTINSNLQLNIAPRGEATITTNTGESVKLSNILIKVTKSGVTVLDVAGDIIKTFKFE